MSPFRLDYAADILRGGGIIAYPTEAVYGLGCDPWQQGAVERLLLLKHRPMHKGLILVAGSIDQVDPLLSGLSAADWQSLEATWPGPATWLVPHHGRVPDWISGGRDTVALRVSAHPLVQALCKTFGGPLVSTSANPTGLPPARTPLQVRKYFQQRLDLILTGKLGDLARPTPIRDLRTGHPIRD